MTTLKPCPIPWCLYPEPLLISCEINQVEGFQIACLECDTITPLFTTKEKCIEVWNTRSLKE